MTARRAIIYCRISRDKTGAGLGVERQEIDCRELAKRLDWTVVEVLADNDTSAYKGVRKGYRRLLAELEAERADAVISWHNDRLHRSPLELEEFIEIVEKHGVEVHFVRSGPVDLSSPSGRLVARQLGAIARYESEHRSERISRTRKQQAEQGRWGGGTRPFGFESDGVTLIEGEARAIRDAVDLILHGGSLRSVCRMLNERGFTTTKRGRPWAPLSARDMLVRPRNAGLMTYRGQVQGPGGWPAIISREELEAVSRILSSPERRTSPGNTPRWLGSMLFLCGVCGGPLIVGTSGGRKRERPSYLCRSHERGPSKHVTRTAPTLDAYVTELVLARLKEPDLLKVFGEEPESGVDVAGLRRQLAALEANRDALGQRLAAGEITLSMFDMFNKDMRVQIERIEAELASAATLSPLRHIATAEDVEACWEGYDLAQRRDVVRELMVVRVLPARGGRRPDGGYFDSSRIDITWRA